MTGKSAGKVTITAKVEDKSDTCTVTVSSSYIYATVVRVQQAYSKWCWSASAEMVDRKLAPSSYKDHYAIVTHVTGKTPPPDVTGSHADMLKALNFTSGYGSGWKSKGIMSAPDCLANLKASRSSAIYIWYIGTTTYHVVVADAYRNSDNTLQIVDLWYWCTGNGRSWYTHASLAIGVNIQSGNNALWNNTYYY